MNNIILRSCYLTIFQFIALCASAQVFQLYNSDDKVYYQSNGTWKPVFHQETLMSNNTIVRTEKPFAVIDYKKKDIVYNCPPASKGERLDALITRGYTRKEVVPSTSTKKGDELWLSDVVNRELNNNQQTVKFHYLLVGVHDFEDGHWKQLPIPNTNVTSITEAIEQKMIPTNNLQLGCHLQLLDKIETTRESVLNKIISLTDSITPHNGDMVMLYLSSHGVKDKEGTFHFVTSNTQYDSIANTINNSIIADTLNTYINKIAAKGAKVLVFVDACYSGTLVSNIRKMDGSCVYFLSTENDLVSFEDTTKGSPFARALAKCLSSEEQIFFRDHDYKVTPQSLQDYLFKSVQEEDRHQRPASSRFGYDMEQLLWIIKTTASSQLDSLTQLARQGNTDALVELGDVYSNAQKAAYYQVDIDTAKAHYYYNYAYEWRNPLATCRLGTLSFYAKPTPDYNHAFHLFKESAEKGCDLGRYYLCVCYSKGLGTKPSKRMAKKTLKKISSISNDIKDAFRIEQVFYPVFIKDKEFMLEYENGEVKEIFRASIDPSEDRKNNPEKYIWFVELMANDGDADYQAELGDIYLFGHYNKSRDFEKARIWYNEAIKQNNKHGFYGMGLLYTFGAGVEKNYQIASDFFNKAADKKNARAYSLLGNLYFSGGYGLQKNECIGVEMWKKAAELGDDIGLYEYGLCYKEGICLKKDNIKAFKLIKNSAKKGNTEAQYFTGVCLFQGIGTTKDTENALAWLQKAKKQGNENAKIFINKHYYADGSAKERQDF